MKALPLAAGLAMAFWLSTSAAQAQYKAPKQYFPKNYPPPATPAQPVAPKASDKPASTVPQQLKFKDLPQQTTFHFLSDTNRAYPWTKVSASEAKNMKTGTTRVINLRDTGATVGTPGAVSGGVLAQLSLR